MTWHTTCCGFYASGESSVFLRCRHWLYSLGFFWWFGKSAQECPVSRQQSVAFERLQRIGKTAFLLTVYFGILCTWLLCVSRLFLGVIYCGVVSIKSKERIPQGKNKYFKAYDISSVIKRIIIVWLILVQQGFHVSLLLGVWTHKSAPCLGLSRSEHWRPSQTYVSRL